MISGVMVINSLEGGGAERVFARLVNYFNENFHDEIKLKIVLLDEFPVKYKINSNVEVVTLDSRQSLVKSVFNFLSEIKKNKPDFILSFLTRANCAAVIASKLLGVKSIISERVNTSSHFRRNSRFVAGRIQKYIVSLLYPMPSHILAVSNGVKESLINDFFIDYKKITVINNPVDVAELNELAIKKCDFEESDYIVSVGRLVKNKGVYDLIGGYKNSNTSKRLVILGTGPEMENVKQLISKNKLDKRVSILGFVDNPYPIMRKAKAFVSASHAEGFPNALAEAMALSLPVISTDCQSGPAEILQGECKDVWTKGKYGYLTPVGNVEELSKAIDDLESADNEVVYSKLAFERSKDFQPKLVYAKYLNVIRQVVAS